MTPRRCSDGDEHHDQGAPPVAEEQEDHQSDEHRSKRPFDKDARDGSRDIGRLVKLERDFDVVRQNRLHRLEV